MTSSSDVLRAAFDRHLWATDGLIDALDQLDPERLDASVPGTYGSILQTLTHLIDADDRYLLRMTSTELPPSEQHRTQPLGQLRDRIRENRVRWNGMLDALDAGTLDATIAAKEDYPRTEHAEALLFAQALHHGDDHRAQICSTLGALGLDVPELDVWDYWLVGRPAP